MNKLQEKSTALEPDCACDEGNVVVYENILMSKRRILKNLLILSVGFWFLFNAYMSLENLQSSMNSADSVGVTATSVLYGTYTISTLFLPNLIIKRLGYKLTLVVSMLAYSPYIAANFYPKMATMLPTAVLIGAGASTLWISCDVYINELSFIDAKGDILRAALSTSRFFGIFQMVFQTTRISGNLVSFYVLSSSDTNLEIHQNFSANENQFIFVQNISCGAEFCGGINKGLSPLPNNNRSTLVAIYFVFSIIAALILLFFLDSLPAKLKAKADHGLLRQLAATVKHLKKTEQQLLVVLNIFTGLEQGFIAADYTEAFIACTIGLQNIGLVFVCYGATTAVTALTTGRLLKYVPRIVLMLAATTSNISVCIALLYWKPEAQQISTFYILISAWGFSGAIFQTQLSALYGVLFRKDEEAAFANYRFWQSLGMGIVFNCNKHLCTSSKIYMLIGFLIVGMAGYIATEIRTFMKNKK